MAGKGKNVEGILKKLEKVIEARQYEHPTKSYVATLWEKGDDYILKKIGEEASEFIIAGKNKSKNEISNELDDFLFHAIVLLKYNKMSISDVINVLEARLGRSGLEEKKSRSE